jgi:exonuclease SbcC
MKPLFLEVCGFGPFRDTQTIDFSKLDSLFVISGETGSGKTTLFDAISYALYEKPLGKRSKKSIRCDFCGEEDSTWVRFRFEAGGCTWEIYRAPYLVRQAKRGSGTVKEPVTTLHRIDGDQMVPLAGKPSDVTKAIVEEILHLTHEQFSKILVLPQGEFQKFLEEESKDRSKLLRKLFPVSLHEELVKRVQEHATDLKSGQKELETALNASRERLLGTDLIKGASRDEVESMLDSAAAKLDVDRDTKAAAEGAKRKIEADARASLEAAKALQEKFDRRATALTRHTNLQHEAPAIRLAEAELEAARRAARGGSAVDRVDDLTKRVTAGRDAIASTQIALTAARQKHETASLALQGLPEVEARIEAAQEALAKLNIRLPRLTELARARRERTQSAEARTRSEGVVANQNATVAALVAQQGPLEGVEIRLEAARLARAEALARVEALRRLSDFAASVEKFVGEVAPAREAQKAAEDAEQARLAALVESARGRLDGAQTRWRAADAARLSALLVDGEPCPVCGATEHPSPARADGELKALEDLVASAERELKQAESAVGVHSNLQSSHASIHDERAARSERDEAKLLEAGFDAPAKWRAALADIVEKHASTDEIWKAVQDDQQRAQQLQKELDGARTRLSDLVTAHSRAAEDHARKAARVTELEAGLGAVDDVAAAVQKARNELAGLSRSVDEDKAHCGRVRHREGEAARALAARESQLAQQVQEQETNEQSLEVADRALRQALRTYGFADVAMLKGATRTPEQERALEHKVKQWSDAMSAVQAALTDLNEALDGQAPPDIPALTGALTAVAAAASDATELRVKAAEAVMRFEEERARHTDTLTTLREAEAASAGVVELSRVLSGDNVRKVKFPDWVLSWWLDQVLLQANTRLQTLSEGRYHLLRRDNEQQGRQDRRKAAGLDLDILDAHTGVPREVNTMSGGEKFLASVSLALGLADVIQMNSGAIELDTLFIDEGFGTLSDHFRELVLEALDELGSTRQVGVISHVKEVKAFIPCQVQLHKSMGGSSVTVRA